MTQVRARHLVRGRKSLNPKTQGAPAGEAGRRAGAGGGALPGLPRARRVSRSRARRSVGGGSCAARAFFASRLATWAAAAATPAGVTRRLRLSFAHRVAKAITP